MATDYQRLVIADLRGGRNGIDAPLSLKDTECVDAVNVDWYNATLARRRGGSDDVPSVGSFPGKVSFLGRHVPGIDEGAAELWGIDDSSPPVVARMVGGSSFASFPTMADAITGNPWDVTSATLNGKFFLAYASAVDRLHVWDPVANTVRRTGLTAPAAAPGAANNGSGSYLAVARWYRMRWVVTASGVTVRRSEPSAVVAFTPSGTGASVAVTRGSPPNEGETGWDVEASADGTAFYRVASLPLITSTYFDSATVSSYANNPLSDEIGAYVLQKSYKFLAVDQNRVLGFGSWNAADKQTRIEFSSVVGSRNVGDEERVPIANYLDLDENDSGAATGLVGPVQGSFFAFKYRQIWKLTPTGSVTQPYSLFPISKVVGAVSHHSIKVAEDEIGNPSIYFLSSRGPYRLGSRGLEYIGRGVEDLTVGPVSMISGTHPHAVYHADKKQVWIWFPTHGGDSDVLIVWDVLRSAWSRFTGDMAAQRCSVMFATVLGSPMSSQLKPYAGGRIAGQVIRCDSQTNTMDLTTPFQGYVVTKPYPLGGLGAYATVGQGTLTALANVGAQIMQTLTRDFGVESRSVTVSLTPAGSETRVQRLVDGAMGSCYALSIQLGDPAPSSYAWILDALTLQYRKDQDVA